LKVATVLALQSKMILSLFAVIVLLTGCREGAEAFFSGRPSEMAMVHNRIIAGSPESMIDLLQVPIRFPDATVSHIGTWQESIIAWWRHAEKHDLMISSFSKISPEEIDALRTWVSIRTKNRSQEKAQALDEIEAAINTSVKKLER